MSLRNPAINALVRGGRHDRDGYVRVAPNRRAPAVSAGDRLDQLGADLRSQVDRGITRLRGENLALNSKGRVVLYSCIVQLSVGLRNDGSFSHNRMHPLGFAPARS